MGETTLAGLRQVGAQAARKSSFPRPVSPPAGKERGFESKFLGLGCVRVFNSGNVGRKFRVGRLCLEAPRRNADSNPSSSLGGCIVPLLEERRAKPDVSGLQFMVERAISGLIVHLGHAPCT